MTTLMIEMLNQLSTEQLSALVDKLGASNGVTATSDLGSAASRNVLVAYYIPKNLALPLRDLECHVVDAIAETELKEFCTGRLTSQQCPTRFIAVNRFPSLPNGKLALDKLPAPTPVDRAPTCAQAEASSATVQLVAILSEILGMTDVRPSDNFFEIGGDSITAIQFISKARDAGLDLEVAAISQSSTIAEMADACKTSSDTAGATELDEQSGVGQFAASGLDESELDDFLQSFE